MLMVAATATGSKCRQTDQSLKHKGSGRGRQGSMNELDQNQLRPFLSVAQVREMRKMQMQCARMQVCCRRASVISLSRGLAIHYCTLVNNQMVNIIW